MFQRTHKAIQQKTPLTAVTGNNMHLSHYSLSQISVTLLLLVLSPLCAYNCSCFLRTSLFPQFPSRSSFDVQTVFIFGTHDISISNTFIYKKEKKRYSNFEVIEFEILFFLKREKLVGFLIIIFRGF